MLFRLVSILLVATSVLAAAQNKIVPGALWLDTSGKPIQAHAIGVGRVGSTFYWFGEDHTAGGTHFTGIRVYSSVDLYNWKNEGLALSPVAGTQLASDQVGERPKVIWSPAIGQWILYLHVDNQAYSLHLQGTALSTNITGPYKYQGNYQPLGAASQDFGLFLDDDSQAYALYGSGGNNKITRLNSQYTNESTVVYTWSGTNLEAPTIFKRSGTYYQVFSQKTGYRPNDCQLYTSTNIAGPWSGPSTIAPSGTHTWNSQSSYTMQVGSSYLFLGDRWDRDELSDSRYMWLPMTFDSSGKMSLVWHDVWTIDVATGQVTYPTGDTYEAEAATLSGSAKSVACSTCSGGKIVSPVAANSTVTFHNVKGLGYAQWVSFYYINTDDQLTSLQRVASVSVNGGASVALKQRTSAAGVIVSAPLELALNSGAVNTITVSAAGTGLAGDLDKIIVYA